MVSYKASRKGNGQGKAMAKNFFEIMKLVLLYDEKVESAETFIKALEVYMDYYNNKRIKTRLKGKSPIQYRTLSQSCCCLIRPTFGDRLNNSKNGFSFFIFSDPFYNERASSIHNVAAASLGIRQSPRGERLIEPTLGPSGMHERLNCCAKKRRKNV